MNQGDLFLLARILDKLVNLRDVASLRQTCRLLRDGVDESMRVEGLCVGKVRIPLARMLIGSPWRLLALREEWVNNPWFMWVAQGDPTWPRPDRHETLRSLSKKRKAFPALHAAALSGRLEMATMLMHAGFDKDFPSPKFGHMTPFMIACAHGQTAIVRLLLKEGIDSRKWDRYGNTPLFFACDGGHLEIMQLLLKEGADKDKARDDGVTPLWKASHYGHLEVVRLLIEAGADKDKARNTDGVTPLFMASQEGHLEIVQLLVEAGADKDKANNGGATPLFMASQKGHLEVVRLLVEAGADLEKALIEGLTPLHFACYHGHLEITRLLVEAGADIENVAHGPKITPIDIAVSARQTKIVAYLQQALAKYDQVSARALEFVRLVMENTSNTT